MIIRRNLQPMQGPKLATLASTPPPPLPATSATTTTPQDFQTNLAFTDLQHIDDPTGLERRLFGGWASLEGVAPDGKEVLNNAFAEGAQEYLDRNPIILWNHKNYLPIGRVLSITLLPEGVWVEGEIFRATDLLALWESVPKANLDKFPEAESIAAKCEEAWWLITTRAVRGLSVRGRSYGFVRQAYCAELGNHIEQVLRLDLIEISVAPIQCHPGTRIEAINTLARSLRTTNEGMVQRALHLFDTRSHPMDPKEKELLELQQKMRALMEDVAQENGGTVPEAFATAHAEVSRALGMEAKESQPPANPPAKEPPASPAGGFDPKAFLEQFNASLNSKMDEVQRSHKEEVEALNQRLDELSGRPAPRQNRTTLQPQAGAQAKPGDLPAGPNTLQRSLDVLSDPARHAKGEVPGMPEGQLLLASKLLLASASSRGKMRIIDGVTIGEHEKMILNQVQAL